MSSPVLCYFSFHGLIKDWVCVNQIHFIPLITPWSVAIACSALNSPNGLTSESEDGITYCEQLPMTVGTV